MDLDSDDTMMDIDDLFDEITVDNTMELTQEDAVSLIITPFYLLLT